MSAPDYPKMIAELADEIRGDGHTWISRIDVAARLRALLPKPLVLKPGWWVTRRGDRAIISVEWASEWYGFIVSDGAPSRQQWTREGRWSASGNHPLDIIAPAEAPNE